MLYSRRQNIGLGVFGAVVFLFLVSSSIQNTNINRLVMQGTIMDSVLKMPIPATISVFFKSKKIASTAIDSSGVFLLNLPKKYIGQTCTFIVQPNMKLSLEKKNVYANLSGYVLCNNSESFRFIIKNNSSIEIYLKACIYAEQGKVSH